MQYNTTPCYTIAKGITIYLKTPMGSWPLPYNSIMVFTSSTKISHL